MTMTAFKIDFIEAEHPLRPPKTQEAKGPEIAVPFVANRSLCALRAVKAWLGASGIVAGPLLRSF